MNIDRKIVEQALDGLMYGGTIDAMNEVMNALRAALEQPAPSVEPVSYEYQTRDGKWSPFINKKHYEDTVADGSWPIRALYTSQPDTAAQIDHLQGREKHFEDCTKRAMGMIRERNEQIATLQAKLDVAVKALEIVMTQSFWGEQVARDALAEIEAIK